MNRFECPKKHSILRVRQASGILLLLLIIYLSPNLSMKRTGLRRIATTEVLMEPALFNGSIIPVGLVFSKLSAGLVKWSQGNRALESLPDECRCFHLEKMEQP